MSHYGEYIAEREGYEIVEDERGFANFNITGEFCYLRDIYVHPNFRNTKVCFSYADRITVIAKERGCKYLLGSVFTKANNPEASVKVLLAYGFKIDCLQGDGIFFKKEI